MIRMSVAERERYVRWWVVESGLSSNQLRAVAAAIWGDAATRVALPNRFATARRSGRRELREG